MRGREMFVQVRVAVGGVRRYAVVVAAVAGLASVAAFAGTAQAASAPRAKVSAETTSSSCGTRALSTSALRLTSAQRRRAVAAGGLSGFDIASWLGEKVAGGGAGAAGGLAFNQVLKLTGLKDKLVGPDPIVAQLQAIETQLKGVNERLDQITGQLNDLTKRVVVGALHDDLTELCKRVVDVEDLYAHSFIPSVTAGVALGKIWTDYSNDAAKDYVGSLIANLPDEVRHAVYPEAGDAGCSEPTDKAQLVCNTPRELVTYRLGSFRNVFTTDKLSTAPEFISNYLKLHPQTASLMTDYGAYLMTKQTLTLPDSQSLRDMYDQFAETEALAAWMSMEYYAATTALGVNPDSVLDTYNDDKKQETGDLSPMIPEGVVVDLGQLNAVTTRNHPIWTLASTEDTTSWPINVESNNAVTTTADGAGDAVKAFNGRSCSDDADAVCFTAWKIPSGIELKALLSNSCQVTGNPPQLPRSCTPFVPSADYPNVVNYLATLNRGNLAWNEVFCRGSVALSCDAPADQHTFIWTTDRRSHTTNCAHKATFLGIVDNVYAARIYSLRVGLPLSFTTSPFKFTSLNQAWPIYPIMAPNIPNYGSWDKSVAYTKCDEYARTQIPLPTNKGIVFVTQNTGRVDFMAQPANAAVEQKTAQNVADDAAAEAKRYGRRHHGSFSGLSLDRLGDEFPDAGSGEPAYLVAARAIHGGAGFTVTAQGAATDDTFTITRRASGAVRRTCTRVDGGAGRHGCRLLRGRHGRW